MLFLLMVAAVLKLRLQFSDITGRTAGCCSTALPPSGGCYDRCSLGRGAGLRSTWIQMLHNMTRIWNPQKGRSVICPVSDDKNRSVLELSAFQGYIQNRRLLSLTHYHPPALLFLSGSRLFQLIIVMRPAGSWWSLLIVLTCSRLCS